jgi:hypothetical protein
MTVENFQEKQDGCENERYCVNKLQKVLNAENIQQCRLQVAAAMAAASF